MGMTMTQKILANAAGKESVKAGELIMANLNLVLGNDITTPVAIGEFDKIGLDGVFDKAKVALVPDHFTPNKDIKSAQQALKVRTFAKEQDIVNYFEVGEVGIEHALLPEKGLVVAGDVVIGADLHTVHWVLFQQVSAQQIWQPVWQQVRLGLKFPRLLKLT